MFARPTLSDPALAEVHTRHSNGLEQFFSYIKGETGLSILDLAGANQANVSFITSLGHRLYSEDFLRNLEQFYREESLDEPLAPAHADAFLRHNLSYPARQFDGVLVWDVLEYLEPAMLTATVERLHRVTKPASYLLAIFHSQERLEAAPRYAFRIQDAKTLILLRRSAERPRQLFNNRSLERLFQGFESVKFFLTRDNLREVIVKR